MAHDGRERVAADAARLGLAVRIVARPDASSLEHAAKLLGVRPDRIVKSLVVRRHDGGFLFALVPGGRKVSWPKLRGAVGVNRLALPDADAAFDATGYPRGAITPLGSAAQWPVYADLAIPAGEVALGAGERGYSAFVDSGSLLVALGASVADLTEPE